MEMTKTGFGGWIERQYLEWQLRNGRASIRQFSDYLGFSHVAVINWMNGKTRPGPMTAERLAATLGLEVYDVLGLPRPDAWEYELVRAFRILPESKRQAFIDANREFVREWFRSQGWQVSENTDQ